MVTANVTASPDGCCGRQKGADLAGDLGDNLGLAAPIGGAGVAGGAVVQAGKLHAPAARKRPGQRVAGRLRKGSPLLPPRMRTSAVTVRNASTVPAISAMSTPS